MKKITILIITLFALFTTSCFAQVEAGSGFQFGIKAGINVANVTIKTGDATFSPKYRYAPTGGFFASLPIGSRDLRIQPELLYSGLGFRSGDAGKAKYTYLVLPVLLKYAIANTGVAAYAGPQIGYVLTAKEESGGPVEDVKNALKSTDIAGIIGVEYTFPVGVTISSRYQLGFTNIAKESSSEEFAKLNAVTFTVGYRLK